MLMAFDKNKDGKLTKAEVPERLQGVFARADDNTDGVLTADEIKKAAAAQPQPTAAGRGEGRGREGEGRGGEPGGRGGPPRRDALFTALDQDGDGGLSADEIAAAPASLKKLDTNGDGILSLEEVFAGGRGRG
jgi:Ca2+-binding EF-hand superfamily protein